MKKLIFLLAGLIVAIQVRAQVLTPKIADSIASNSFAKVGYPNSNLKKSVDSATIIYRGILSKLNYTPDVVFTTVTSPITLKSNTTYQYLTIDLKGLNTPAFIGNGITNVHITHCRILNTPNMAIKLYKCTNVIVDYCYFNMVMFGAYAQQSQSIKFNNNQLLNLNDQGALKGYYAHAFQFDNVTGSGNQINYNRVENIANVAVRPHDILSIYHSSGLKGDSIQVIGNWIRGGQISYYGGTASSIGATGIGFGDETGQFIVVRANILVNPGGIGMQTVGSATDMKVDHNYIFIKFPFAVSINVLGMSIQDKVKIYAGYNRVNITNQKSYNGMAQDGEPAYWNPGSTPTPTDWNKNVWQDQSVTANILPEVIITMN